MKRLLALRHAKAAQGTARDIDRPLTPRGRRDAALLGELLLTRGWVPARTLCSPALRARETAELVLRGMGRPGVPTVVESLYGGDLVVYLAALAECPETDGPVLLVAHNPTMEALATALSGEAAPLGTCDLAVLDLPIPTWSRLTPVTRGTLVELLGG